VVVHVAELFDHILLHVDDVFLLVQLGLHLLAFVIKMVDLLPQLRILSLCFRNQISQVAAAFLVFLNILLVLRVFAPENLTLILNLLVLFLQTLNSDLEIKIVVFFCLTKSFLEHHLVGFEIEHGEL